MSRTPLDLVEEAVGKHELESLFLGEGQYAYLPKFSPSAHHTDLAVLLTDGVYEYAKQHKDMQFVESVSNALLSLAGQLRGVVSVASVIVVETLRQTKSDSPLVLDLSVLSTQLRKTISEHRSELVQDKQGVGAQWPDGVLGELKNLNATCTELGGPAFM